MEPLIPQDLSHSLSLVPFDRKWDLLKPTIERLYIQENWKLSDIIKSLQDQYGFDAAESQYKYHIKKWKLKKSISTSKKAALYQVIQTRAQLGKSSVITRGGQNVDTKNLRRYLKTEARQAIALQPVTGGAVSDAGLFSSRISQFGNRIFMNWNMPYGALKRSAVGEADHASPLSDLMVTTPQSSHEAPSPTTVAVRAMTPVERARLFVQGRHNDLLQSLEKQQMITMSTWMYHFWLFSFKTAKHWGRGPRNWTADILGFDDYRQRTTISISSPNTPGMSVGTPAFNSTPRGYEMFDINLPSAQKRPSPLCRWSIHCADVRYERLPSPPRSPPGDFNVDDEQDWPTWPASLKSQKFTEKLNDGLASNGFSNVRRDDLPIAANQIAVAVRRSPNELLEEALGFSIMSRNVELIGDLLEEIDMGGGDISGLYPFHLAINYLDGSKTCCSVLEALEAGLSGTLRKLYVNDLGHTILDQLMIAILKAHTSCPPSVVDVFFKNEKHFEGIEVDVCGRWDADSDCVRMLLADGTAGIPFEWKHMFCHTAVQTICHCIGTIFGPDWGPDINTPSGLFVRRCSHCGLKLQLLPLQTLILVGLHLSRSGCKGETLFGILACLLCLLSNGANPLLKAHISLQALMGNEEINECSHEELDPAELAEIVPASLKLTWSRELRTGWQVVCNVLKHSQSEWKARCSERPSVSKERERNDEFSTSVECSEVGTSIDEEASGGSQLPVDCSENEYHQNFFGGSKVLATLWAAVQTELLTYRRLEEGDGWVSQNFNMETLNHGLLSGGRVAIALVENGMMKSFCDCGEFPDAVPACAIVDNAANSYFSNLENWDRSTFISSPLDRVNMWFFRYNAVYEQ